MVASECAIAILLWLLQWFLQTTEEIVRKFTFIVLKDICFIWTEFKTCFPNGCFVLHYVLPSILTGLEFKLVPSYVLSKWKIFSDVANYVGVTKPNT